MKSNYNILIVEDELLTAENIKECILNKGYKEPVIKDNFEESIHLFHSKKSKPNLLICDIQIKGTKNGIQLSKEIRKISPCEIIFLTANNQSSILDEVLDIEPNSFLLKPFTELQLITAIEICFKKYKQNKLKVNINLSPREFEIVKLIREGLSSKEIAEKLCISIETVHTHRRKILAKNEVKNFNELNSIFRKQ